LDLLCKSSWILKEMISSLTIKKLNHSWNFQRNWNVPWKDLDEQNLMEFSLGKIWIQNFGSILILKWFLPLNILNKFPKKPGFGRKNQLRMW
jgi:hypothetical protein